MMINSRAKPGPDSETTSSMPKEPEQVSVNTTMTAVNSLIFTRLRPWLFRVSVVKKRLPLPCRLACSWSGCRPGRRCVPGKYGSL